jgi:hypothetical protein
MNPAQLFAAMAAQAAQGIRTNSPADGYVRLAGKLMEHASQWSAVASSGLKCAVHVATPAGAVKCTSGAIGACVVCGNGVCFQHAMVAPMSGDMICFGCVARAGGMFQQDVPKPPWQQEGAAGASPHCTCSSPDQLDSTCPIHGRDSDSDVDLVRRRYLRVLGLDGDADWDDVRDAYKAIARKHHPDKFRGQKRKQAERKFSRITSAYNWLKSYYDKEAAA